MQGIARDVVVIGASAGGVPAVTTLVADLPADLPAAVLVAMHMGAGGPDHFPEMLERAGLLAASYARQGEEIRAGHVYVAPPGHHLRLRPRVVLAPTDGRQARNGAGVDALFRSAAASYGKRVLGVVLTGELGDGTAGLLAVKKAGGVAVVQHPADARHPTMPLRALERVRVDYCLPLVEIGALIDRLSRGAGGAVRKPRPRASV